MVKFHITFLLPFPIERFDALSKTKIPTENKTLTSVPLTEDFEMFRIKLDSNSKRMVRNITYKLPCQKAVETCISVLCWKDMAKVFMKKIEFTVETVQFNFTIWVAFTVVHRLHPQDANHLKAVHPSIVDFKFNDDPNQLLSRATGSKGSEYYALKPIDDIDNVQFRPVFPVAKEYQPLKSTKKKVRNATITSDSPWASLYTMNSCKYCPFSDWGIPQAYLKIRRRQHSDDFIKQWPNKLHLAGIIKAIKFKTPSGNVSWTGSLTSRKSKEKIPYYDVIQLKVENLYYDKSVWTLQSNNKINTLFLSVNSWMTDVSRQELNPIGIQIHSVHNLPEDEVLKNRVKSVCVEYQLEPVISKMMTPLIEIKEYENVNFNHLKTFLTCNITPLELISTLQSRKLTLKILGKCINIKEEKDDHIFGTRFDDYNISNCCKKKVNIQKNSRTVYENGLVLLGIVQIDLSPLVFGSCCVLDWASLTSKYTLPNWNYNDETFNALDVHLDKNLTIFGSFPDSSLIDSYLKFTGKLAYPLSLPSIENLGTRGTYNRALAIIHDNQTSASILKDIWDYNSSTVNLNNYVLPMAPLRTYRRDVTVTRLKSIFNPPLVPIGHIKLSCPTLNFSGEEIISSASITDNEKLSLSSESSSDETTESEDYISGFIIDCLEFNIMMIEGTTDKTFPKIHEQLMKISVDKGRVLLSTDLFYMERLYKIFKRFGGLYCITMKKTPSDLLKMNATYLQGSIPVPAKEVLFSIPALERAKSMLPVVQNNLLPTPPQLMSFDIEFGLPLSEDPSNNFKQTNV